MENKFYPRPLKQPKVNLDDNNINPILKKLIQNMNKEGFMLDESDLLKRLEEYRKVKYK
jgi:hypothetical protein